MNNLVWLSFNTYPGDTGLLYRPDTLCRDSVVPLTEVQRGRVQRVTKSD